MGLLDGERKSAENVPRLSCDLPQGTKNLKNRRNQEEMWGTMGMRG